MLLPGTWMLPDSHLGGGGSLIPGCCLCPFPWLRSLRKIFKADCFISEMTLTFWSRSLASLRKGGSRRRPGVANTNTGPQ